MCVPWSWRAGELGAHYSRPILASWWPAQAEPGAEAGTGPAGPGEGCPLGLAAGVTGSKADFNQLPPLDYVSATVKKAGDLGQEASARE